LSLGAAPASLLQHPLVVAALQRYSAALGSHDAEAVSQLALLRRAAAATRVTMASLRA